METARLHSACIASLQSNGAFHRAASTQLAELSTDTEIRVFLTLFSPIVSVGTRQVVERTCWVVRCTGGVMDQGSILSEFVLGVAVAR